jgi:cytochrome c
VTRGDGSATPHPPWDAQRTSGNTDDLSGKLLRIHPEPDGTYTVPAGNLFPPGTDKTRPEIYAMGLRNPFRIGLDPETGHVMVADYGPDAASASATRGPENTVEWNLVDKPGNYGWPYCIGNKPYVDFDFATRTSGSAFDCAAPVNDSPNNTGLTTLPPAIPATVWYHYQTDPQNFPELNGGAPMGARSTGTTPTCGRSSSGHSTGTARRSSVSGTPTRSSHSSSTRPPTGS